MFRSYTEPPSRRELAAEDADAEATGMPKTCYHCRFRHHRSLTCDDARTRGLRVNQTGTGFERDVWAYWESHPGTGYSFRDPWATA